MLKVFDSYKKALVPFKPIKKGYVGMYLCGPTIYDFAHIGNFRTYTFSDILRRTLVYMGYKVKHVMNLTDVGHLTMTEQQKKEAELTGAKLEITDTEDGLDRMEKAAKREGMTVWQIADKYAEAFLGSNWQNSKVFSKDGDMGKLNMLRPDEICKVTDHIQDQIDLIKLLEKKGYTYTTKEAVYFDTKKFARYEELFGQQLEDTILTDRASTTDPERHSPADFRLWQLAQPDHTQQWDSPWGKGFPGWHIECSAISTKYLGQPFDIHLGGEDLKTLHHVNEIAQSEAAYDKTMANYWLHGAFITVDGKKMSKSLGNVYKAKDIEGKGYSLLDLRYLYLGTHYHQKMNFTFEALESAKNAREKLIDFLKILNIGESSKPGGVDKLMKDRFVEALENDINLPKALSIVWETVNSNLSKEDKLATILDFDNVLGLGLEDQMNEMNNVAGKEEIDKLIKKREMFKMEKQYKEADKIRDDLLKIFNIELLDTPEGTKWKVKK